jgi:hypothetical protein
MISLPSGAGFKDAAYNTLSKCDEFYTMEKYGVTVQDCEEMRWVFAGTGLVAPMSPIPSTLISQLPEMPNLTDLLKGYREQLRQAVNDLLGDWSPLKLWAQIQAEIDKIRNNYWVRLAECISKSDQACINRYAMDLVNAVYEAIVNALCSFCSGLFIIPTALFVALKQRRMRY